MNAKNSLRIVTLVALGLAAGCGGPARKGGSSLVVGGSRPAWVEGESPDFPRSRFVTGVGSADDDSSAADRARAEVSRAFSVDVNATTSSEQSEASSGASTSFASAVSDKVRTTTRKVLEGVDVVARWKDASTGRYYALAALPKDQALLSVTQKASELDAEAAQYKARLAAATDPFEKAKAAAKLLALAKARTGLEADSRVLGGGALPGDFDSATIKAQAAQALGALAVVVSASGDGAEALSSALVTGLNASGLAAKRGTADEKADLTATATVSVQEQNAGDARWKRSRASATVSLIDGRSGKAFANFDASAREDAVDAGEARRRALASLAKTTAAKVSASIDDYFSNQ